MSTILECAVTASSIVSSFSIIKSITQTSPSSLLIMNNFDYIIPVLKNSLIKSILLKIYNYMKKFLH